MIKIKNLSFYYGKAKVFNNFNLTIQSGEVTLITGINGVGKSTLLRLLAGVLKPAGGEILFEDDMDNERVAPAAHDVTKRYSSKKKSPHENKISSHSGTEDLPLCAPVVEIDRLRGSEAGGRWVFAANDAKLSTELIRACIDRAGVRMGFSETTPAVLARQITDHLGEEVSWSPIPTAGAPRAAELLSRLLPASDPS